MIHDIFSPKERLFRVLNKKDVDRPPVICPGGMMNAAIVDIMTKTGHVLPAAHHDSQLMGELAQDIYENTGFENFGVPFCMTVEAEVLGSTVNYGTLECEPKIQSEKYPSVKSVEYLPLGSMGKNNRVEAVIQTIYKLSKAYPDIPTIGSITGPLSTSASIINPMVFLKELWKDKQNSHNVLRYVCDHLLDYARLMVDNGASLISIADPTATGEILGPNMFREYAMPYLNYMIDGIHKMGVPVIIHICGQMKSVKSLAVQLRFDALSVDAVVSLKKIKESRNEITTMGNLSTIMLQWSNPVVIQRTATKLIDDKIDIIAPACGLSTSTPLNNIKAFTNTIKFGK